ncbi:hypothetical protein SCHPADRAFT_904671 [Schizopora paradoxa]|uniref:Uncharacterized protein n=1 Tax=Schizopora paradoxa TaxID=27342 RepID=A0A0H2RU47_9AGAM|nr:hypothetical protein SCHPADRAFT_904671 [Schizopora paradoxa]
MADHYSLDVVAAWGYGRLTRTPSRWIVRMRTCAATEYDVSQRLNTYCGTVRVFFLTSSAFIMFWNFEGGFRHCRSF